MRGQQPKHTARLEEMTRYRLRIKQFPLILRATLHTKIIANNHSQQGHRHAGLFRTLLAGHLLGRRIGGSAVHTDRCEAR